MVIHCLLDLMSWFQAGSSLSTGNVTFGDIFLALVGSLIGIGYGVVLLILDGRRRVVLAQQVAPLTRQASAEPSSAHYLSTRTPAGRERP
jgi:hypothetical protein